MLKLRSATLEDLDTLLSFEQGIVEAERPFDHTLKPGEIHYYDLAGLIERPDAEVIVAEKNGAPVGSGYVLKKPSDDFRVQDFHAHIGFLYVKPEHRKQGINRQILDALLAWADDQKLSVIQLEVYQDNLPALRAYEKSGFTKHLIRMRLTR